MNILDDNGQPIRNQIHCIDALDLLRALPEGCVDLVVTSPPYDNLRTYNGYSFDFEGIAHEAYRVIKQGGVMVWVVGDQIVNGGESITGYKQVIHFVDEVGFKLHDTMIYEKNSPSYPDSTRYYQVFEFMYIFCKGKLKTFNAIIDRQNTYLKPWGKQTARVNGKLERKKSYHKGNKIGVRFNIWKYKTGSGFSAKDDIAYKHPAIFPEDLARDHIISWSNPGDLVLDPFIGSGTTALAARNTGRDYLGCDLSAEYVAIARERLSQAYTIPMFDAPPEPVQARQLELLADTEL